MRVDRKWISPGVVFVFLFGFLLLSPPNLFANEPTVTIQVLTEEILPGEEIQIQVTVTHNANSFLHHVEWVNLLINDLQSYHWAYSARDLPPAETFKKVAKYRVPSVEKIRIVAEAYCLRHGSSGKITALVTVKK
jgi:desulfoferrodoxin (superoxide reductase-like protein)